MYVKLLAIQLFPLMEPEVSKCNLSNLNLRASETDVIDDWLKENIKVWHEYDECHWKVVPLE
jgi:hypothetical protein